MKKLLLLVTSIILLTSCHQEQAIPVEINVSLHIKDENHTSPMYVTINNETKSASSYLWTFEGGEPATSDKKDPSLVRFTTPGDHKITLEAWNDGDRTSRTYIVRVDSAMVTSFKTEVDINNYAPATFKISNLSSGGSSYQWIFDGGTPSTYTGQNPPLVTYQQEGIYTISLKIDNGSATSTFSQQVVVREPIDASFTIVPSFEDQDDYEAPLRATFSTHLQSVESLVWESAGATISNSTSPDASIYFPSAGTYTVYLNVSNGKTSKRVPQSITVKANNNMRTHKDIRLGINTAQATIGSYYSTQLRRSFTSNEWNLQNGALIDIVYMGLNANFTYNIFVSPQQLANTPLKEIYNAQNTKFINKQELGNTLITPAQFTSMKSDLMLKNLAIGNTTDYSVHNFGKTPLPRVVLFETADGRKGAILVKEMISNGKEGSYIIVDIKVQKND